MGVSGYRVCTQVPPHLGKSCGGTPIMGTELWRWGYLGKSCGGGGIWVQSCGGGGIWVRVVDVGVSWVQSLYP